VLEGVGRVGAPPGASDNGRHVGPEGLEAVGAVGREAMRHRTRAVHAGDDWSGAVYPLTDPISPSTVFAFRDPEIANLRRAMDPPEPNYSREGLPNVRALERAVAELERAGDACAVASGMAAISLTMLAHLDAGDRVIASADCYCDAQSLLTQELTRFGVGTDFVDTGDLDAVRRAVGTSTRLIYVDTISNPAMRLADLEPLATIAHDAGALLCVDNTFATPMLCRPLEYGADLVIHSATKFLGGHHDLTAGVVAGRQTVIDPIRRCGYLFGPTLGPWDAWLALRGIRTLAPRIAWISETAVRVASFLQAHPEVSSVRYPGLPDHPQAELARRLLPDGAGGMLAFDLEAGSDAADKVIRGLRLIPYAPSLGGPTTTVCYPPRDLTTDPCEEDGSYRCGTLRLSIGLEAPSDIIADLAMALDGLPAAVTAGGDEAVRPFT